VFPNQTTHQGDQAAVRDLFLLDPDIVFLNHGSFGACPRPVFDVYREWQAELERQPVKFLNRRVWDLLAEARRELAAFVGAKADDLVYVPNATTGLNVVARSLPIGQGDEVLSTDHEYGALDRTWRFICKKRGARFVRQPVPLPARSTGEVVDAIWSGVTGNTRVLFISHISSFTAMRFPVEELVRRAREAGIITVVDGAHAPGQIDLDLDALGADFYAGNCHKWLMAPKGAAFLHARRAAQPLLEPLVVSWGWEPEKPGVSPFVDEQEWTGTRDIASYLAVPAAIRFLRDHDWDDVRRGCRELVRDARRRILALTGGEPLTPDGPEWFVQMAAFGLPPCDGEILQKTLCDEYGIEIPVIPWNGRRLLRISVQGYNTRADVDALLAALGGML
jgi:isopenicillin-N epimerase